MADCSAADAATAALATTAADAIEIPLPPTKIKRQYKCPDCGLATVNPRIHLRHRIASHGHKLKVVECPLCVYACQYRQKLNRHLKLVHHQTAQSLSRGGGGASGGNNQHSTSAAGQSPNMASNGGRGFVAERSSRTLLSGSPSARSISTGAYFDTSPGGHQRSVSEAEQQSSAATGCSLQHFLATTAASVLAGDPVALNFFLSSQLATLLPDRMTGDSALQHLQNSMQVMQQLQQEQLQQDQFLQEQQQQQQPQGQQEQQTLDNFANQDEPLDLSMI